MTSIDLWWRQFFLVALLLTTLAIITVFGHDLPGGIQAILVTSIGTVLSLMLPFLGQGKTTIRTLPPPPFQEREEEKP